MVDQSHQEILESENSYLRRYQQKADERSRAPRSVSDPGTSTWTRTGMPSRASVAVPTLFGRVSVREPDDVYNGRNDFYIGLQHLQVDGIEVFSWAAPVAKNLYGFTGGQKFTDEVTVVRSLDIHGNAVRDFYDEPRVEDPPRNPFPKRDILTPPRADVPNLPLPASTGLRSRFPVGANLPAQNGAPSATGGTGDHVNNHAIEISAANIDKDRANAAVPGTKLREANVAAPNGNATPLRAEALLRAVLESPRQRSLAPVLSTLQADQYELVTLPMDADGCIIEGAPGTGKTIIATHRAAYLVHRDTPITVGLRSGSVLLVGPTEEYARHVGAVINELVEDRSRISVVSLPSLMYEVIGGKKIHESYVGPRAWRDCDVDLATLVSGAVRMALRTGERLGLETVYSTLRSEAYIRSITDDPKWQEYLLTLPSYEHAVSKNLFVPLRAFIAWETSPSRLYSDVRHVIVDEAQDVTDLEWSLLERINGRGTWTLIGDLNQRRSDFTQRSWKAIGDILGFREDLEPRIMKRGYRSTKAIIDFASQLLPRKLRAHVPLRTDGPVPVVHKVHPDKINLTVVTEVGRLSAAYPRGSVAIIGMNSRDFERDLRSAGWSAEPVPGRQWRRDGARLALGRPDHLRGLEFDGVVVVEPEDFPNRFDGNGPLYTALTRANRELVVVHAKPLPDALRRAAHKLARVGTHQTA
jgi:hypothetical protein